MTTLERAVSIHPYFKLHPGKWDEVRALLDEFVARTAREPKVLYYEFTRSDDLLYCREAYADAAGLLDHLTNVAAPLEKFLTLAELVRVEVHGPAEELAKLREPLGHLKPVWFAYECGVGRARTE